MDLSKYKHCFQIAVRTNQIVLNKCKPVELELCDTCSYTFAGGFGGDTSSSGDGFGGSFGSGMGGSSSGGQQSFGMGGQGQAGSFYGQKGNSSAGDNFRLTSFVGLFVIILESATTSK